MIFVITEVVSFLAFYLIRKCVEYRHKKQRNYAFYAEYFYSISNKILNNDII